MSAPDNAPPESLSGDFLVFATVENFNTTNQTETWVSFSMGEATISPEYEAVETNYHENAVTQSHGKHYSLTIEFTLASIADQPHLETLGIFDSNGNVVSSNATATHEAFRVYVYNDEPDPAVTADSSFEFTDVEVRPGEITHGVGDPGEVPITVAVNGGWREGTTPVPSS